MSKTLTIKKEAAAVPAYTADQLRAMLEELEPSPSHVVADKSILPPVEERQSAPIQAPARKWGDHSFTPNQIAVDNINPATGYVYNQVVVPARGGMISPPPSRNFR